MIERAPAAGPAHRRRGDDLPGLLEVHRDPDGHRHDLGAGNIYLIFNFDPYPFIFLNLAFSTQAAYAAPLILLASNRAAIRDRLTLEHAAKQTDVEEGQNERLLQGMTDILRHVRRWRSRSWAWSSESWSSSRGS